MLAVVVVACRVGEDGVHREEEECRTAEVVEVREFVARDCGVREVHTHTCYYY